MSKKFKIAVAGTGYVGLSIATLLSQHNQVTAVDVIPEKVNSINQRKSPIQDSYISKYLAEKELNLTATLDGAKAYSDADFVIIAAPTNYDPVKNFEGANQRANTVINRMRYLGWIDDATYQAAIAEQRVAAALAAGGTLVNDNFARSWWVLADADGNEACVCTWQDR